MRPKSIQLSYSFMEDLKVVIQDEKLKAEELYIGRYKSEKDLKEGIANYIDFYNNKRPHSVIRYSTPQKYEDRFYNKNKKRK